MDSAFVAGLAARVIARDRPSIAAALNLVEDRRPSQRAAQRELLRLVDRARSARRIGITGPPGAGKSTLCAALARAFIGRGQSVGVVAVDPSSPKSGGALLGDRVRIVREGAPDPRLFVRSLAAGGDLGGLSRAAPGCIAVLAASADVVLVETVGVGQSEVEVAREVDLTVVVVQPSSGDALQFLKAGLFEIPDVVVIGKSDLGDVAQRAEAELRHALGVAAQVGVDNGEVAVACASGLTGAGIDGLADAIEARFVALDESGALGLRRREGDVARAFFALVRRVGEVGLDALGGEDAARARIATAIEAGGSPLDAALTIADASIALLRPSR